MSKFYAAELRYHQLQGRISKDNVKRIRTFKTEEARDEWLQDNYGWGAELAADGPIVTDDDFLRELDEREAAEAEREAERAYGF